MMMMSSNTVGNNDFNTAGVTPLDAKKKTKAKKETELKLAKALPDSFERTAPRDTASEAPPTAETLAKTGGSSVIAIGLSAVSLIGAGIAGFLAFQKGGEAEAASKLAKAAQEDVVKLTKQLSETVSQSDMETYLNDELITFVNGTRQALDEKLGKITTDTTQLVGNLAQRVDKKVDKADLPQLVSDIEVNNLLKLDKLKGELGLGSAKSASGETVNPAVSTATASTVSSAVTKRAFPAEVQPLFESVFTQEKPTIALLDAEIPEAYQQLVKEAKEAVQVRQNPHTETKPTRLYSLALLQGAFEHIDFELPKDMAKLSYMLPQGIMESNDYRTEIRSLAGTAGQISEFYQGNITKEGLIEALKGVNATDEAKEAIVVKAQAVVEGKNATEVKTAQRDLVTFLQETFGRSRVEQFEVDYPKAVGDLASIARTDYDPKWITDLFTGNDKTFDTMSDAILGSGFNTTGKIENLQAIADPHVLESVVLHNLEQAFLQTIKTTTGEVPEEFKSTLLTIITLKDALKPMTKDTLLERKNLFGMETEHELSKLEGAELLQAKFINARLNNNTAEMESITTQMYALLREHLGALKNAEAKASPAS